MEFSNSLVSLEKKHQEIPLILTLLVLQSGRCARQGEDLGLLHPLPLIHSLTWKRHFPPLDFSLLGVFS